MKDLFKREHTTQWVQTVRTLALLIILVITTSAPIIGSTSSSAANSQLTSPLFPDLDAVLLQALTDFHGPDLTGKDGPLEKIGFDLTLLHAEYQAFIATTPDGIFQTSIPLLPLSQHDSEVHVVIDAIADQDASVLLAALQALGLEHGEAFGAVVSGELPVLALPDLAALSSLGFALPAFVDTDVGVAANQADVAMGTDRVRSTFGINGSGVKVGVMSDSYNCLGGAAGDVASGDIPQGVEVVAEEARCTSGRDEGRAMMQLIADVAPGAGQAFHTAL
jgi:hypothetical protein